MCFLRVMLMIFIFFHISELRITFPQGQPHPNRIVDWFDVLPSLASIPKTANMASKLCVQLHQFPKDIFQNLQVTKILTGQESKIISNLEVELRILVCFAISLFLC
jgi:hypothetical protein